MIGATGVVLLFFLIAALIAAAFGAVLYFLAPREIWTIFKREFFSYFNSPIAYVLFVVYTLLSAGMSFFFWGLLEREEANLTFSYFQYLPLYLALIVPAVGMRIWSEEQRQGTMELMLTMPLAPWHAIVGKFLAAAGIIFVMLVLSFPILWTINFLGEPASALTRSQLVAFLISFAICLLIYLSGFSQVATLTSSLKGISVIFYPILALLNGIGVMPHFTEMAKGVLTLRDIVFFASFVAFCLFATSIVIRLRRA